MPSPNVTGGNFKISPSLQVRCQGEGDDLAPLQPAAQTHRGHGISAAGHHLPQRRGAVAPTVEVSTLTEKLKLAGNSKCILQGHSHVPLHGAQDVLGRLRAPEQFVWELELVIAGKMLKLFSY